MSIQEIIARLERATGPDRAYDDRIMQAIGGQIMQGGTGTSPYWILPGIEGCGVAPFFTSSVDDALTLAPKGWSWRVGNLPSGKGFADLGTQSSLQCVEGATPAIAICIAALKARAACS